MAIELPVDYRDIPIENYIRLCGAILSSAGNDYRTSCINLVGLYYSCTHRNHTQKLIDKIKYNLAELYYCQQFFRSELYNLMCDIDGQYVIDATMEDTGLTNEMITFLRDFVHEEKEAK